MKISIEIAVELPPPPPGTRQILHVLMTPLDGPHQKVSAVNLEGVAPDDAVGFDDAFGNRAHLVSISDFGDTPIVLKATAIAETTANNGVLGRKHSDPSPGLYKRLTPETEMQSGYAAILRAARSGDKPRLDMLYDLLERVREYTPDGAQFDASERTAMFIALCRAADIPARYVSGCLVDGPPVLHNWSEIYDDLLGWLRFDPSPETWPSDAYVKLSQGLDATTNMPVRAVPMPEDPQIATKISVAAIGAA